MNQASAVVVKNLNERYIKVLKSFGIEGEVQTTRFTQRLLNSISKLVISNVNKSTVVLFGDKIDALIVDSGKISDEFYATLL